jgi:TolB-like protein
LNAKNFLAELKRRNVYKVAVAYAVVGWLLVQVTTQVFPFFEIPNWGVRLIVLLIVVGFPIALVIAWAFELTPEGLKRTEAATEMATPKSRHHAWIFVVITAGALSLGLFFIGRYTAPRGQGHELSNKSIAVLPFESLSEDKSNAYFADGIQDEILARLSKIADLKVISRTSTQKYKSAPANLREIAQQLDVANILEGSVQKAADQVRVTVQLINAENDSHLWSETYDRKLIDIFQVESDVAQKIAGALEAKLTGKEKAAISSRGTDNPQAYEAYLHAVALRNAQSVEDQQRYIDFCRRAVDLDPNFAQAWAELAVAEANKYFFPERTEAQKERARVAAENALRLAPNLADAHTAMGLFFYYCQGDYENALTKLEEARQLAPNDWKVISSVALVKRRQGKLDEAIALQNQAVQLDPLNEDIWVNLGRSYAGIRKFDLALNAFDRALNIDPNSGDILVQKTIVYVAQGDLASGWQIMKDLKFRVAERGFGAYVEMLVFQRRFGDAIAFISSAIEREKEIPPTFLAISHAALGRLHWAEGRQAQARALLIQAEGELKQLLSRDRAVLLSEQLTLVEALLGQREEVERLGKMNFEIIGQDKWQRPLDEETLAQAYTILGDFDRALPLLTHALVAPSAAPLTPAILRLDPIWDSVRNDPRFEKLANQIVSAKVK